MCCAVIRFYGRGKLLRKHILLRVGRLEANLLQINCNSNGYALSPSTSVVEKKLHQFSPRSLTQNKESPLSSRYKDSWASEMFWRQGRRKVLWVSGVETWPSSFQPLTDLVTIKYNLMFIGPCIIAIVDE